MALKAVHFSELPNLDRIPQNPSSARTLSHCGGSDKSANNFLVIGHRGNGMNMIDSPDRRLMSFKENTILSFNKARKFGADFIEFDVQVLKDECPVIFHDNFIWSKEDGRILEKRVTELNLPEFLSYGPQRQQLENVGKSLVRKTKDGEMKGWEVEKDDAMCTLREAFQRVDSCLGFNIELKFDDTLVYQHEHLVRVIQNILQVVAEYANERAIIFSSFHPDATLIVRKLQTSYPVLFLTNGGCEVYSDSRRNSLEAAMEVCLQNGLQGVVSEVRAILQNPKAATTIIRNSNLSLLTYGQLNNVVEVVRMQQVMGVDGVIVDLVEEVVRNKHQPTPNSLG